MEARLLSARILCLFCACMYAVHGNSTFKPGSFEESSEEILIETSQLLAEDEKRYERNGGNSLEDSHDGDKDDEMGDALQRVKRTTFNVTKLMWPHRIPYVMEFTGPDRRYRVRKVLDDLEDQLCVKFFNEESRLNKSNPTWLKDLGYDTNAYMYYHTGSGCFSVYGQGGPSFTGPRRVSPCYQYLSILHETLHSLGGIHSQKLPIRDKYLTAHMANVYEGRRKQYKKTPVKGQVNFGYFDPASSLMYGNQFYGSNGPTYDLLRPEMGRLSGMRSYKTLMYEMTQNYKCAETFCSGVAKDCGPGYLTFLRNECVCICPDQYDPDNNCATLKPTGSVPPTQWPSTPFTMYKAGSQCPEGFSMGTIPLPGKMVPVQTGVPLPTDGKTLNIEVCSRSTPTDNMDWYEWPIGSYCVGKVAGVNCSLPFTQTTFKMKTTGPKPFTGEVGDVTIDGYYVIMNLCCAEQASTKKPMLLPTSHPFRLHMAAGACQEVEGMFAVPTSIKTKTKTAIYGYKPENSIVRNYFTHYSCLYVPPVYGCNQILTLNADHPKVTFSTPEKGSLREGSRRCFFAFQAPDESRLRLSFDKFSIHPHDKFFVKRFHPWTNHYRVLADSRPTQMITEKNYLFVEFWSHFEEDSKYTGAQLTVDLLFDKDLCYTPETNGEDYAGDQAVTELYEDCVDWKDATSCPDFPWERSLTLFNSGNKCRNLGSSGMLQPWCYSHVEGEVCVRRYCDVCNEANVTDATLGCQEMISANPDACLDPFFRNGCFKSCDSPIHLYNKENVRCTRPVIPEHALTQNNLQESYSVGSTVGVTCSGQPSSIECTAHGWTPFKGDCIELCIDTSQLCQNALTVFPNFCTHELSSELASEFCKKSCGLCEAATCSISDTSSYTVVTPSSGGEISTGQAVTFACLEGLTYVSGDVTRACSMTGQLLGAEPNCQGTKYPVDLNIKGMRERYVTDKFLDRTAVLLLSEDFRIPFDGTITQWVYYCRNDEDIVLLVYRQTDDPETYELVGSNPGQCVKDRAWRHWVDHGKQVSVKKGDFIGAYQSTSSFGHSRCGYPKTPVVTTKRLTASDLLGKATASFVVSQCFQISLGAHVEPSS